MAVLFGLHPLRAESVAWISERKDVLSGLFFLLTLWAYAAYASHSRSWPRYGLVIVLFFLGLMAKPMLVPCRAAAAVGLLAVGQAVGGSRKRSRTRNDAGDR